jgi:hypothetical protein
MRSVTANTRRVMHALGRGHHLEVRSHPGGVGAPPGSELVGRFQLDAADSVGANETQDQMISCYRAPLSERPRRAAR